MATIAGLVCRRRPTRRLHRAAPPPVRRNTLGATLPTVGGQGEQGGIALTLTVQRIVVFVLLLIIAGVSGCSDHEPSPPLYYKGLEVVVKDVNFAETWEGGSRGMTLKIQIDSDATEESEVAIVEIAARSLSQSKSQFLAFNDLVLTVEGETHDCALENFGVDVANEMEVELPYVIPKGKRRLRFGFRQRAGRVDISEF